ncbi:MAG: Bug family tripartite tricarboxylate transporter substrate binding protein [Burkholderiaceae bacterium]
MYFIVKYLVLCCLVTVPFGLTHAQSYPNRSIKLVVPWPAGGTTDAAGRILAQRLSDQMGVQVIVDNKAGAAGTIGAESVARSVADGYTLLLASAETHAIAPNLRLKLSYDPLKDFVAITPFAINPFALVSKPGFAANSVQDLINQIKAQPDKFTYSSAGLGSASQIGMETLQSLAGTRLLHVPFQGQAPALTSLIAGQTDFQMLPAGSATELRKAGKVKVYAVSTKNRFFDMPDVPTLTEAGYSSMNFANWFGIVAPANAPGVVVHRLETEMTQLIKSSEAIMAFQRIGLDVFPLTNATEFQRFIESEHSRWGVVIRNAKIQSE